MNEAPVDISQLPSMGLAQLQVLWKAVLHTSPPKGRARDLMRLELAWAAQAARAGGLDRTAQRLLKTHARALAKSKRVADAHVLAPGAILEREWRGEIHRVHVVREGFLWRGRTYASLTIVAREITGLHRSGPHFFGLSRAAR